MTRRTLTGVLLVAIIGLAGCGGSSDSGGGSGSSPDATLKVRDEAAQVKAKATKAFARGTDGQDLAVGDTVRTNGTGFAQVDYRDGSLTRLDSNAQFTLTELGRAGRAQRVVGRLDGGRAWSSVEKVTSSQGRYQIDTDVATAAVRGTQFDIDCTAADGSCTFTVADGTVRVTPIGAPFVDLHAGDSLTVHPDHSTTANGPLTLAALQGDPWIQKNLAVDKRENGRSPTNLPTRGKAAISADAVAGTWSVARTVTKSTNPLQPAGSKSTVTFNITSNCSGTPCTVHLTFNGSFGSTLQGDLTFNGDHFEGPVTGQSPCSDPSGRQLSVSTISGTISITPVAGDNSRFTGVQDVTVSASPGCTLRTTTFDLAGTRAGGTGSNGQVNAVS